MSLSYKEVAEILKIIDASSCEEVIIELDNTRMVVRRHGSVSEPVTAVSKLETEPAALKQQQDKPDRVDDASTVTVNAPMVGLFYARPSPDEAEFVNVGSKVSVGDTLCLIEVMKLYTRVESTVDGVVESVLAENGKLVEFDQPLFIIRPYE